MDHEHARRLLSDGNTTDRLEEHLRDCADCRAYADALDNIWHHAPALVATPPADLHDRLKDAIVPAASGRGSFAPDGDGEATVVPLRSRRLVRWLAGSAAAAAAVVAVAVMWAGPTPGHDDPAQVLAAAVQRVHGADGTGFRFGVTGSTELRLPEIRSEAATGLDHGATVDPAVPSSPALPTVPPLERISPPTFELPEPPSDELSTMLREFGFPVDPPTLAIPTPPAVDIPTIEPPQLDRLRGLRFPHLCDQLPVSCEEPTPGVEVPEPSGYVHGLRQLVGDFEGPDRQHLLERLHLGLELERLGADVHADAGIRTTVGVDGLDLRFDGSGRSDGQQASAYTLDWQVQQPATASGTVDVVTTDDRTWVRTGRSDRWLVTSTTPGFRLAGVTAPHDLDGILNRLTTSSTVRELGTTTIRGQQVRRMLVTEGVSRTEAWIGTDDGLVHRIVFDRQAGSESATRLQARTTFDLYDHGADIDVAIPDSHAPAGSATLLELPPFWIDITEPTSAGTERRPR